MADNTSNSNRNFPSRFQKSTSHASVGGGGTPDSPRSAVGCESPSSTGVDVHNQPDISPTSISPTQNPPNHPANPPSRSYSHRGRGNYGGGHIHHAYNGGSANLNEVSFMIGLPVSSLKHLQEFMILQWHNFEKNYSGRGLRNNNPLSLRSQGRTISPHTHPRGSHWVGGGRRFSDNSHHLNHSDSLGGDYSGNIDDYPPNRRFRGSAQHNAHAPLFNSGENSWQRGQLLSRNDSPDIATHRNSVSQSSVPVLNTNTPTTATVCQNTNNSNSLSPGKQTNVFRGVARPNTSESSSISALSVELNSLSCSQHKLGAPSSKSVSSRKDSSGMECNSFVSSQRGGDTAEFPLHSPKLHSTQSGDVLSTTDHYYTPDPSSSQTSTPPTILSPGNNTTSTNFFQQDCGSGI